MGSRCFVLIRRKRKTRQRGSYVGEGGGGESQKEGEGCGGGGILDRELLLAFGKSFAEKGTADRSIGGAKNNAPGKSFSGNREGGGLERRGLRPKKGGETSLHACERWGQLA